MPHVTLGRVHLGQQLIPHSDMLKTEFYSGIGRPYGLSRMLGCMMSFSPRVGASSLISFNRPDSSGEFSAADATGPCQRV